MAMTHSRMRSLEHATIVESTTILVDAISQDISSISDELISTGIIPDSLRDTLRLETLEPRKRAEKLVDFIGDYVKQVPKFYHTFVDVLKKQGDWIKQCVEKLEERYAMAKNLKIHHTLLILASFVHCVRNAALRSI